MFSSNYSLASHTKISDKTWAGGTVIGFTIGAFDELTLFLPIEDEDALAVLSRLEGAIDNAVSAVRLRQQERDRANGSLGAGETVEAYRG
jgi:hypothetical protein